MSAANLLDIALLHPADADGAAPVADDFAATTATSGVVAARGRVVGQIETVGDADWFAVTLEAGVSYQFVADTLIAPLGPGALGNPKLRLLDASGRPLAVDDDSYVGSDALIQFTPQTSGRWFLEVSGSTGTPATGAYALIAQADSGRNKPAQLVSYTLSDKRLEVIFDSPIDAITWNGNVLAQRGKGAALSPISLQGAPEVSGRSLIFSLSEAVASDEYLLLRGTALPSPRVITTFESFALFDDTTTSLILGADGDTIIDVSALPGDVDILDLGGTNRFVTGATFRAAITGGAGNDQYLVARADTPIQDLGGTDSATVLSSATKLPSDIETVTLGGGAAPLPYWISALVADEGAGQRFSLMLADGRTYSYAFPQTAPDYLDARYTAGFKGFSAAQAAQAEAALQLIAASTGLRFVASDNAAADDLIAFALNSQTDSAGYAIHPRGEWLGSDVFLNAATIGATDLAQGSFGAYALTHEIGHALGLKHPFSATDATGDKAEPPYLSAAEDQSAFTIMTYTVASADRMVRLGPLDVAALQYLYGPNPGVRAGADRYTVSLGTANFIWDGGGADVIDLSGLGLAADVGLEPGYWGFVGTTRASTITAPGQITVNAGTAIEDLVGTPYGDRLTGNALANQIQAGAGDDTVDGGAGDDTLVGGPGRDSLIGSSGNDVLAGGSGSDMLVGGDGTDRVTLEGNQARWHLYANTDRTELAALNSVTLELDRLRSIETLQFSDAAQAVPSLSIPGVLIAEATDFARSAEAAPVLPPQSLRAMWTGSLTLADADALRISVPAGHRLTSARLIDLAGHAPESGLSWSLKSLATADAQVLAGGTLSRASAGTQLLSGAPVPGSYLLELGNVSSTDTADYAVELRLARANTRPAGTLNITGTPRAGELLTVSQTLTDPDGLPAAGAAGAMAYQWRSNGAAIVGATGTTYRLSPADVGSRITVSAAYTDLGGTAETMTSAPSSAVLAPLAIAAPNYSPLPRVLLKTSLGDVVVELEADRAPVTVTNFLRYANTNFYDGTEFHRIISTFMAQGGGYDLEGTNFVRRASTFSPIPLERTSTTGLSNLTGTLAMARTSVADSATSEFFINLADNLFLDAAYASDGNGYAVFGRVASVGSDLMSKLKAVQVVDNGSGEVSKPTSAVTLVDVLPVSETTNAAPTGSVMVSGLPIQGRSLIALSQLADADGIPASGQPGAISYYWKADGILIPGAQSASLTLTQAMVGKAITAVAAYTDLKGTSGYVASDPIKVINANDLPGGRVVISGTPAAGATLTASHSLTDQDGIPAAGQPGALRWQWNVDGQPVAGRNQSSFLVSAAEANKSISVTASYTDLAGTAESITSAAAGSAVSVAAPGLPRAWLRTNYGDLLIELESTRAASTVANFVQYVKSGFYNGTIFHRVIDGFMIQGGGYTIDSTGQVTYKTPTQEPIALQSTAVTGLSNTFGTIAMARTGDPNSATSQFFINVADNLFLDANRAADGNGYAVFGRVLDGYPTIDILRTVPVRASGGEVSSPTITIGIVGSYYDPKPPGGEVLITGNPVQGQTLTAQHTLVDPDGFSTSSLVGWVWRADGIPVSAISPTPSFQLTPAHVGKVISVEAIYRDSAGNIGYVPSASTAEVGLLTAVPANFSTSAASAGAAGARAAALTGSIYHWKSHALIDEVQVTAQAQAVTSADTPPAPFAHSGIDGRWAIDGLDFDGLLRVTAGREAGAGEVARAVSAADALAALKLATGRTSNPPTADGLQSAAPISPYQVLAADIDRDGKVTPTDADAILKLALGVSDAPASRWRFAGESEVLWNTATGSVYTRHSVAATDTAVSARAGQTAAVNLVGVLTGDVDGSWTPGDSEPLPDRAYDQLPTDYFQSLGLAPEALAQWGLTQG
jgi:cyclophilin family peptidyl-prolyl cis-trans isomerase